MIKLWNQTMPHRCPADAFEPYLTPYFCDGAKTAIVVCAGGAYSERVTYEGDDVAVWLNTIGITAFVPEYRVAPSKAPAQPSDAQRAMRLARKLCMERGIERLGIMGFSAGGHLAATLSVHYDEAFYPPQDELDNLSAYPDFTVLCYSVIDMGEYRHDWSRRFLLGDVPDEAQIEFYSPQRCVTENTSQLFSKVRLHIDTGAPNGVAFQRILLHNIALFREQLPDCVDLLCHSVCGCQFLQRRVHYAASDLQEKRLIAAANFHA